MEIGISFHHITFQYEKDSGLSSPKLCLPRTPLLGTVHSVPIYMVTIGAPVLI